MGGASHADNLMRRRSLTHPVRFNETHKDGEEDWGRHRLGAFTKKCHRIFKRILEAKRKVHCVYTTLLDWTAALSVDRRSTCSITLAIRASSCSLLSRVSFLLMKSLSVLLCWTLNSLQVSSMPRCSSFTSHSTFSRLTAQEARTRLC